MAKKATAKKTAKTQAKKGTAAKKGKKESKPRTLAQHLATFRGDVESDIAKVVVLADDDCVAHVRMWIPTGCLELDRRLTPAALLASGRVGGFPCGRLTEIFGPAHIGKSTLLDHAFASVQKMGGAAILLETDSGRDQHYTGRIGVDMEALQYFQFAEDAASIENVTDEAITTIKWWKKNAPDTPVLLGFDALGVTPTNDEIKKTVSEGTTASAAKVLRKACRKIAAVIAGTNIAFVVLNHEYSSISFGGGPQAKKTYGGDAVTLLAALRIKLHRTKDGWIKSGKDGSIIGTKTGYEVVKFKLGHAYQTGTFAVITGAGIDNSMTLWDVLSSANVLEVKGAWGAVNINGEVIKFQGWLQMREKCRESPELYDNLISVFWQTVGAQNVSVV